MQAANSDAHRGHDERDGYQEDDEREGPETYERYERQVEDEGDELSDTGEDHYGEDKEPKLRAGGAGREDVPVAQAEVDGVHEWVT